MATIRQRMAYKKVLEGAKLSHAMKEVGYAPSTSKTTGKLTRTKGWQELLDKNLSDRRLVEAHSELLDARQPAYFTFSKQLSDEEITEHVEAAGFRVIVIRDSDKGKLAFYSTIDTNARKSALDMAYKLKNKMPKESPITAIQVNVGDDRAEFTT